MQYSTIVEKNDEGLMQIIDAAEKFEENRYLEALYNCKLTQEDVIKTSTWVANQRTRLRNEHLALAKFALVFNQQYATDNNKCFDVAEKLFNRIRSTICGSKRVYKKFCKRNRQQLQDQQKPSVFKRSELVRDVINGRLFGFEAYDECALNLYKELEAFFQELILCLALCHGIITGEKEIRRTPARCMEIYRKCYAEMVANTRLLIGTAKAARDIPESIIDAQREPKQSLQDFVCAGFHKYDKGQFTSHVVYNEIKKGEENGLTEIEVALFGADSIERVMRIRIVIEHFDELEPEGHKGKLKADCVASFMIWCGIGEGDNKVKSFVEDYFNATYRGAFLTVKFGAVNSAKNKQFLKKSSFDDRIFHQQIDALVAKYSGKGAQNTPKVANF